MWQTQMSGADRRALRHAAARPGAARPAANRMRGPGKPRQRLPRCAPSAIGLSAGTCARMRNRFRAPEAAGPPREAESNPSHQRRQAPLPPPRAARSRPGTRPRPCCRRSPPPPTHTPAPRWGGVGVGGERAWELGPSAAARPPMARPGRAGSPTAGQVGPADAPGPGPGEGINFQEWLCRIAPRRPRPAPIGPPPTAAQVGPARRSAPTCPCPGPRRARGTERT